MSLESYKKQLQAQRERDKKYAQPQQEVASGYDYIEQPKSRKRGWFWMVSGVALVVVLFLAALKNPSKAEAKAELKSMIMDVVTAEMRQEVTNEDNDVWKQICSGLAMLFAPTIIDNMVQTEISDYIFFSTFDARVAVDEEMRTLVSGIILFGKVIPLKSDIKQDSFSETE